MHPGTWADLQTPDESWKVHPAFSERSSCFSVDVHPTTNTQTTVAQNAPGGFLRLMGPMYSPHRDRHFDGHGI